jgi:hypothetical protein
MPQIMQPEPWEADAPNEAVPVAGERVRWERLAIAPLDDEVEIRPGLAEEESALRLIVSRGSATEVERLSKRILG